MSCQHCVNAIKQAVSKIEGVQSVAVDLDAGQVTVTFTGAVDDESVVAAIEDAGYEVE
ncbi:MAG: heavy-metal-associated domain-containing protein [Firmicutes bacterium]|nr:heavy-metal-associated domain-containing protein [Bacillota bacterium]